MAAKEKSQNGFVETIKTIVYALLIAGVFRTFFFQPFWIPSGSMKETLLIGDFLFVNKMAYGYSYASCPSLRIIGLDADIVCGFLPRGNDRIIGSAPERGAVVVFRHPVTGNDYIKRLIGLPGDTVQMRDGQVILNGAPVPQEPNGAFIEEFAIQGPQGQRPRCAGGATGFGADCIKERSVETLPEGRTYAVLNINDQGTPSADNTAIFQVPEGHFFFIGDNRDNSADSRLSHVSRGVGFVPYENLIGRADRVIFSSAGRSMLFFWTWRSDRFFKGIE
ncbi:MAG: signal peptidase I [Pseudomonadota bacterium]